MKQSGLSMRPARVQQASACAEDGFLVVHECQTKFKLTFIASFSFSLSSFLPFFSSFSPLHNNSRCFGYVCICVRACVSAPTGSKGLSKCAISCCLSRCNSLHFSHRHPLTQSSILFFVNISCVSPFFKYTNETQLP